MLESKEQVHNRITYTGQQFDSITGQYYLRARFYNSVIGRFTQEDIYRGDGLNLYSYCKANQVVYYDPSGYESINKEDPFEKFYNDLYQNGRYNANDVLYKQKKVPSNFDDIDRKFFSDNDWRMQYQGAGEAKLITNKFPNEPLPANGRAIDYTIEGGKINGLNGQKNLDFVIDSNGELKIGSKHHYLGNAEDVKAAGQLKLDGQGGIRRIDNLSGHYRPTVDEAMNYPELFRQNGLNVKNSWLELYDIKVDADGFVESVNKTVSKKIK